MIILLLNHKYYLIFINLYYFRVIFEQYDMSENFSDVFQNMIYAFSRLIVSEKPSLISSGSSANLFNRNMSPNSSQGSSLVNLPHGNDSSMLTINNSCIRIRWFV